MEASPATARTSLPPPPAPVRSSWSTPAKGLAIAMVVAFHSTQYLEAAGVDVLLGRGKVPLELYPMPAFFLVVGMAAASHRRLGLRALWWRRLAPLLYLYVLWSLVLVALHLVAPRLGYGLVGVPSAGPRALLLVLVWPMSVYWFLHALLVLTLLRWLVAPAPAWAQLVGSAVVSTLFTTRLVETGDIGWDRAGALFVFFVAGAVLAGPVKVAVGRARPRHLAALALGGTVVTGALLLGLRGLPLLVLVGQVVAVAFGAVLCALLPAGRVRRVLTALGEESLTIYLVHLFVVLLATALVGAVADPTWPRGLAVAVQVVLAAISLWGSLLLARQVRKVRWLYLPPTWMLPSRRARAVRV